MIIHTWNEKQSTSYFDNNYDLSDFLKNTPAIQNRNDRSTSADYSFTGTNSFEEAIEKSMYGDEQLSEKIKKIIQTIDVSNDDLVNKIKMEYENSVVGFMPNVPNYLIGSPNSMINSKRKMIKNKIINIYVNQSVSWKVSKDDIINQSSKIVAAIDYLERQGYRCNLFSGALVQGGDSVVGPIVKIKNDRTPLNVNTMAFQLAHPSVLRRLSFKYMEIIPRRDLTHSGYGTVLSDKEKISKIVKETINVDKLIVFTIGSEEGKVADVVEQLKKGGDN